MATFNIHLYGTVSTVVEVEAETFDGAVQKALENAPNTNLANAEFDGVDVWEVSEYYTRDGKEMDASE